MADPRGDVKDGDNFLLDFIKNKRWVNKEEEEETADDDKKGHNSEKIPEQGREYQHLRGKVKLLL